MPKNSLNVSLKGADDIFSTEESRQEQQREQVQQISIGELFPFKNHPFKVLDDESIENQTMRASGEPPTAYGRYENIFLSKDEYDELQAEYPDRLERLIEEMSHYLAASGKAYQNYAAALHRWAANDKKGAVKQGIPDYTCMEGESL